jgi:hypothetical protein
VETVYIPVVLPKMAKTTQGRYGGIIDNYLRPQFEKLCLRDISVLTVDRYFTSFCKSTLAQDSVRTLLSTSSRPRFATDYWYGIRSRGSNCRGSGSRNGQSHSSRPISSRPWSS